METEKLNEFLDSMKAYKKEDFERALQEAASIGLGSKVDAARVLDELKNLAAAANSGPEYDGFEYTVGEFN